MPDPVVVTPTPSPAEVVPSPNTVLNPAPAPAVVVPEPVVPAPVIPAEVKLELKLPENSLLNQARVDQILSFAKEKSLTNEQAQMVLDRESDAVSGYKTEQEKEFSDTKNKWVEDVKALPDFSGDKFKESSELAHRAATRFFTPAQMEELNKSGLGNHPTLVEAFYKIGKAFGDDKLVIGLPAGTAKKSQADMLYDKTPKE